MLPRSPFILFSIIIFLSGQSPDAIAQSSKENADFKLAMNLFNDGLYDLAVEQLRQFIGSYPSSAQGIEARFYLGEAQLKLRQFDEARLTFQTFALTYQDNPKAPDAWWKVGEAYAALGNHKEAALAYERVKVFHPGSTSAPNALVNAASYFKLARMQEDARRVLRIVLQEYPASEAVQKARTLLGELYFEEGNVRQAQTELSRVIDGDPSPEARAQALLILGDIYVAQWRLDQARVRYEEIIAKHKNTAALVPAYVHLGGLYLKMGKYAEALDAFNKAFAEKGEKDSVLMREAGVGLGDAYEGLNDHSKAVYQYEQILKSAPEGQGQAEHLWRIVLAHSNAKEYERVTHACNRILAMNPPDALKRRVLVTLARNAESAGNPAEAVRVYSLFLESYPNDRFAPMILTLAATLSKNKLHDPRRASLFCEQVISRFPRSPHVAEAYGMAAECYEQLNDVGRSLELRREFLRLYPSSERAGVMKERVRYLEIFEAKDKDAALQELALLLGDIVAEHDKAGLAFRLGETYFNDLKNYAAAATQFTTVINSGITDNRFEEALLYRARSYGYLSWRDPSYRSKAIDSYTTFLDSYHADPRADEAALALFELRAISPDNALSAYRDILAAHPQTRHRAEMLLRIGVLQHQSDSLSEALETFGSLLEEYASSPAAEEACYRRFDIFMRREMDSAITEGKRYLARYPGGPNAADVLARIGDVALLKNAPELAIEFFSRLLSGFEYTTHGPYARRRLADAYASDGRIDEAIALYGDFVEETTENPFIDDRADSDLLLSLAKAYRQSGNIAEARLLLFQLLSQERSGKIRGEAFAVLGLLAKDDGDVDLATAYFQQAGAASPDAGESEEIAKLLFDSGAYADAIRQYELLAAASPSKEERRAFEARAILARFRSDDLQKAQAEVSSFMKKYGNVEEDLASFELEKGNYYFRKGDYTNARASFDLVTKKFDETQSAPEAMYWIGKVLEATGKQKEAVEHFDNLLEEYPASPIIARAHLALGNLSYHAEQWDDAVRHYKRIVDDPKADPALLPFAMSNLIETYEASGVFDAALDLTRKYLDRFPTAEDSFDKRMKIGILYQRLGYNDQSVLHLQSLLDEAGSDLEGEIRYYIAEANFQKGDYQQAILDFLKVPYLVTKKGKIDWTANALYMSGQSYERLGRYDQALAMYRQIIERQGIDETFKAAAKKEIDRVKLVMKKTE